MIDVQVDVDVDAERGFIAWFSEQIANRLRLQLTNRVGPAITKWAQSTIRERLLASDTYRSLKSGSIAGELGLGPEQQHKVDECVEYVSRSVTVELFPADKGVVGGIRVVLLSGGIPELLAQQFAEYISMSKRKVRGDVPSAGHIIPWLEWLLTKGHDIILSDYRISFNRTSRSRTGMAFMIAGHGWGLPYGGEAGDNWIEDTLRDASITIGEKIVAELNEALK